ncbi:MAG: TIGR04100 family radical SAM protein [Clostridia bacterium]|nr:TIGR04100 family radical SAM protein [Clostridia bacterium]
MTLTYKVKNGVYVNMTNRCPCACTFCLRHNAPGVYGSDPLWLDREPTVEEVIESLKGWDLSTLDEVVFCGYGEPTERLYDILKVAEYIRSVSAIKIRINTNGLSDLIHGKATAPALKGLVDTVSVSLNATNAEDYLKVCRPKFGIESYDAMLAFTRDCTKYVPSVVMTVVDVVTSKEEQAKCKAICDSLGATLRIRPFEE